MSALTTIPVYDINGLHLSKTRLHESYFTKKITADQIEKYAKDRNGKKLVADCLKQSTYDDDDDGL